MTAKVISLAKYRKKKAREDRAIAMAADAGAGADFDAIHVAMRWAFPFLARDYPCSCAACRKAGLVDGAR